MKFLLILLISSSALWGQTSTVFEERFNDNSREWDTLDEDSLETSVAKGVLRYERTATGGSRMDWKDVDIDWSQDWSVSLRLNIAGGTTEHGSGIVWGTQNVKNYYGFVITHDGYFQFYRYNEGEFTPYEKWKQSNAVKGPGSWNTLRVTKQGDAVSMYVNDTWIAGYLHSYYRWFGNRVGMVVHRNLDVSFDDLVVTTQKSKPINLVKGIDSTLVRKRLPRSVNSAASDFVDGITPDGRTLYISRADHSDNVPPTEKRDLWVSQRASDGSWGHAVNMGKPINNEGQNFLVTVMPDGNQLYLQNTYNPDGSSLGGGISISRKSGSSWTVPEKVEIEDYYNLSNSVTSFVAPNGQILVMSLHRRDTKGDLDLYVCKRQPDGSWGLPMNMGETLNTMGGEIGPFIAADDKTLIFSSAAHPGFGGYDLFVTKRLDDSWTKWSTPENLGPTINSDEFDAYMQFPVNGDSAYFSSNTSDNMSSDVYSIILPVGARAAATVVVRGRVLDAVTGKPLEASVVYERLSDAFVEGRARSNGLDGTYSVALSGGKEYGVRAEAKGYYPLSTSMNLTSIAKYDERVQDLLMVPIEKDAVIRLNNVFFDSGKYDLRAESFPELDRLVEFLRKNMSINIALAGHTDNVGKDADNLLLSQNRINSVQSYLVGKGIDSGRLTAKGYGKTTPIAPNDSEQGRQQNRRVEFKIVSS